MGQGTPLEVGVLFDFGGRPKTHGQQAMTEFGIGVDHMMRAAHHAAGGVGSAVGPRMHGMRSMMSPTAGRVRSVASSGWGSTVSGLTPLMAAAREGAREATEAAIKARVKGAKGWNMGGPPVKQKRMGLALGLLAAGVAVGAVAALVVRRRRRAWEEYDPSDALESMMGSVGDKAANMREKAADLRNKTSDMAGDVRAKGSEMSQKTGDTINKVADKSGDAIQKAGDKTSDAMQKSADKADQNAQKASDRFADTSDRLR
jgi:hypothetical protein